MNIENKILTEFENLRDNIRIVTELNNRLQFDNRFHRLRDEKSIGNQIINLLNVTGFGNIAVLLNTFGIIAKISSIVIRYHLNYILYNVFAILAILYYIETRNSTLYCTIIYK